LIKSKPDRKKQYRISAWPHPDQVESVRSIQYLTERGITSDIIERYGLVYGISGDCTGVSIADSLVIPVYDLNGVFVTFQVRYLAKGAPLRWRMPSGSPAQNVLYGGWLVQGEPSELWIVEGASDVWTMALLGCQSVGLFTKETSAAQLNRLRDLCVSNELTPVICMDGDAVTRKNGLVTVDYGLRIHNELCAFGLDPVLVHLNETEDPGGLTEERFQEIRRNTEGLSGRAA